MRNLYDEQNKDLLLRCLVARHRANSLCKSLNFVCLALSVLGVWLAQFAEESKTTRVYVCIVFAVVSWIAIKIFRWWSAVCQRKAALLQQYFDASVFSVESDAFKKEALGVCISESELAEWLQGISTKDFSKLKVRNWYVKSNLEDPLDRILNCQRQCVVWDKALHEGYFVLCCLVALVSVSLFGWMGWDVAVWKVVYRLLMAGSFLGIVVESLFKQFQDILRIREMLGFIRRLEAGASGVMINPNSLMYLQNRLFEHRRVSTLVPDWFYELTRRHVGRRIEEAGRTLAVIKNCGGS